jgi:hypothetical protein
LRRARHDFPITAARHTESRARAARSSATVRSATRGSSN